MKSDWGEPRLPELRGQACLMETLLETILETFPELAKLLYPTKLRLSIGICFGLCRQRRRGMQREKEKFSEISRGNRPRTGNY
jgi:hypothetical protein